MRDGAAAASYTLASGWADPGERCCPSQGLGKSRIGRVALLPGLPSGIFARRGQVHRLGVTELIGGLSVHLARIDAELTADMRELDRVGQALVRHHRP